MAQLRCLCCPAGGGPTGSRRQDINYLFDGVLLRSKGVTAHFWVGFRCRSATYDYGLLDCSVTMVGVKVEQQDCGVKVMLIVRS